MKPAPVFCRRQTLPSVRALLLCAATLALSACGGGGLDGSGNAAAAKSAGAATALIAGYQPLQRTAAKAAAPGAFGKTGVATSAATNSNAWQWRVQPAALGDSAAISLGVGRVVALDLPDGSAVPLKITRAEQILGGTWSVAAEGLDAAQAARAVLTFAGNQAISGVVTVSSLANSPREWLFETTKDGITLTDNAASGRLEQPFHSKQSFAEFVEKPLREDASVSIGVQLLAKQAAVDGARGLPLVPQGELAFSKGSPRAAAEAAYLSERFYKQAVQFKAAGSTVDLLVAVDATAQAIYGSVAAMNADIATAIMLTNAALTDSKVAAQVRLVRLWAMPESLDGYTQNDILLAMRNGVRGFADLWKEQVQSGADGVMTVVAYRDIDVTAGNCGLAYLNRFAPGGTFLASRSAYGVAARPRQTQNRSVCSSYTFTHELGHMWGNIHDRANSDQPGAFDYSYGHGVVGVFGDIMAYTRPRFGVYSNPDLQCAGQPCGVPDTDPENSADASKTLRITIPQAATTQDPQSLLTGWYYTPPGGTGWAVEVKEGRVFAAVFLYDDAGAAVWYAGAGAECGTLRYCLDLSEFQGGQTAVGAFRAATVKRKAATTTLQFSAGYPAGLTATVDGKVWNLQRYSFNASAFVKRPQYTGMPFPGWYWDSTQPGTGVFIEYQGDQLFAGYFHYATNGSPSWAVSLGKPSTAVLDNFGIVTSSASARVQWASYAGGQTLLGDFRAASTVNAALYNGFVQPTVDYLTITDGRATRTTRALTRFRDF